MAATGTTRRLLAVAVALAAAVALTLVLRDDRPALTERAVTPGDGASLSAPPAAVRVELDGVRDVTQAHLTVQRRADGAAVTTGPGRVDGQVLTAPVSIDGGGDYLVGYHIQLAGGDQLAGTSTFRVGAAGPPAPAAAPNPHAHGGGDPLNQALLVLDLVLIVVLGVALTARPRIRRG